MTNQTGGLSSEEAMPTQGALFKRENPQCRTSQFWALTWETTTFSTRPLQNWEKHRAFSGETLQPVAPKSAMRPVKTVQRKSISFLRVARLAICSISSRVGQT